MVDSWCHLGYAGPYFPEFSFVYVFSKSGTQETPRVEETSYLVIHCVFAAVAHVCTAVDSFPLLSAYPVDFKVQVK